MVDLAAIGDITELTYLNTLEPIAICAMGALLVVLSIRLYRHGILQLPSAVALGISGGLAVAWKYADIAFLPADVRLPFEVAEVQFFVSLSICMTLFALDVFTNQAHDLARAEEMLARQAIELEKAAVVSQMAAIIESAAEAIIGQSTDGEIVSWNAAAASIFGHTLDDVRGKRLADLVDPSSRTEFEIAVSRALQGDRVENFDAVCLRSSGNLFDAVMTVSSIKDAEGSITGVSIMARDVTDLKRSQELQKMALSDELTGLYNRRGFLAHAEVIAERAARDGKPFTLLFIDLNGLKKINDNLGHGAGDEAIASAASVLKSTFRDTDVLARVGGDEFCVILGGEGEVDGATPLTRLQTMIDIENLQNDRSYKLSLSVGSTQFDPTAPCSIEELMGRADEAMYNQKLSPARRFRLLVGDDDVSVCKLVEALFSEDFEVVSAYSGKDVLRLAPDAKPDLILLDLHFNDMLGTDVVKALREMPSLKLTPVIMITGAGDATSELQSLRAGVDDYVEKPFDEEALRARMDIVMRRNLRR
jgi:diguanylate cyclase (GGDEF)-like protein/PAS domain S-box-containing protein